jgi:KEOPS complex subunit Cgi121
MADYSVVGAKGTIPDPRALVERLQQMKVGQALALDAHMVCGREHLDSAVEHALRAFQRGTSSANNLMMETMLFASGERQISKAQEKMGLKSGERSVALVLFGADPAAVLHILGLQRDDAVLEASEQKALAFGVGREELDMVPDEQRPDLVLERVAFVEILKR